MVSGTFADVKDECVASFDSDDENNTLCNINYKSLYFKNGINNKDKFIERN